MQHTYPDYYPQFSCIADHCRHNCCIGWEIDVDEDTLASYRRIGGEMGKRLRASISEDGDAPHFLLGAHERCPFLNERNLQMFGERKPAGTGDNRGYIYRTEFVDCTTQQI